MRRIVVLAVIFTLLGFGCAQRKVARAPETVSEAEQAPEKVVLPQPPEEKKPEEVSIIKETPPEVQAEELQQEATRKQVAGIKEEIFKDIHFDYNKYNIKPEYQQQLKKLADYLISNPGIKLIIEGHCDERGTNEYNLALGDKRANAVKDFLISAGVSAERIETVSYGEERPICTEHNEDCWWKNRRAHFVEVTE
jgi:peptidoglycan-associated lipoprotein